ncbi:MAG: SDR family NAD(P)-dependent oxidoreductase [Syntrophales bacterium]|jgi:gluconate 5-dehydrogenase
MSDGKQILFDLRGKTAVVTGGGSGLGREFCDVLAEFGANVVCSDIYKDRAEETIEIIKKYGNRTLAIEVDVSKYDQVQTMFKQVESTFGGLDVLVNNAGILISVSPIDQLDVGDWHKLLNVNLHGTFYCMKEGLRIMMKQKKGSIINIASIGGLVGLDFSPVAHYVTSKSAVIGLTKQGAAEYGQYGIRVNSIAPGFHHGTRLGDDVGLKQPDADKAFQKLLSSKAPMKRMGELKEIRGLLIYLASDASSFLTGQIIASDGGWTCI